MSTTTMEQINVRVEREVKQGAEAALENIGLSMSAAINVFLRAVYREGGLPFELKADPFYSEANIAHIRKVAERIDNGTARLEEHKLLEVE